MKRHLSLILLIACATRSLATPVFDSFDGAELSSQWMINTPCNRSSVSLSDGALTTQNRGMLVTSEGYLAPYTISGVFTMHDGLEHFNIALRTDLTPFGTCSECSGLIVTFVNDGQGICIQQYESMSDQWQQIAYTPYALGTDTSYLFSLTDMGDSVSLSLNGQAILSADTAFATGDRISFYSREFGAGTSIDSLSIIDMPSAPSSFRLAQSESVPDGGSTAIMLAGVLGLGCLKARRAFGA